MKAYTRSIFDLFDGKRRYILPLFQRQYVWTQEKQWEPLWDYITRMAEKRLEAPNLPALFWGAMGFLFRGKMFARPIDKAIRGA